MTFNSGTFGKRGKSLKKKKKKHQTNSSCVHCIFFSINATLESLSLRCYLNDKCSDAFQSLDLPVQTFTARTRHASSTESNASYFFHVSNLKFQFDIFLPKNGNIVAHNPTWMLPSMLLYWPVHVKRQLLSSLSSESPRTMIFH